jgi:hypothetical protein
MGVVHLSPPNAVRIGDRYPWDTETIYGPLEPDPLMSPWLPPNPNWHYSPSLDASFKPRGDFGGVEYAVDIDSGTVYFGSTVDYDAFQGIRHG